MTTKQKSNVLPANYLDGHQILWSACLSLQVVLHGLEGQYMGILTFHYWLHYWLGGLTAS